MEQELRAGGGSSQVGGAQTPLGIEEQDEPLRIERVLLSNSINEFTFMHFFADAFIQSHFTLHLFI